MRFGQVFVNLTFNGMTALTNIFSLSPVIFYLTTAFVTYDLKLILTMIVRIKLL